MPAFPFWVVKLTDRALVSTLYCLQGRSFHDTDSGLAAEPFLSQPPSWGLKMPNEAGYTGGLAIPSVGSIHIANPRQESDGLVDRPLDALEAGVFAGGAWEAFVTAVEDEKTGPNPDLTDSSWQSFSGTILKVQPEDEEIIIELADFQLFQKPAVLDRYRGYGSAIPNFTTAGNINFGDNLNPGSGSFAYFFGIRPTAASAQVILQKGDGSTDGILIERSGIGAITFTGIGLSATITSSINIINSFIFRGIGIRYDQDLGTLSIYVDGVKDTNVTGVTGSITATTDDFIFSQGDDLEAKIGFLAFFDIAPTDEDMAEWSFTTPIEATEVGLVNLYNSYSGTTWVDEVGGANGTRSGTVDKIASDEGAPVDAGKIKPWSAGDVKGVRGFATFPGNWEILITRSDTTSITNLVVYLEGVVASESGPDHYDINASTGIVTIISNPTGSGIQLARFDFTGVVCGNYSDLVKLIATSDAISQAIGLLGVGDIASPLVTGRDPLEGVGFHIPTQDQPPITRDLIQQVLEGGQLVGFINTSGKFECQSVPVPPFDTSDATRLVEGIEGNGDFDFKSISKKGNHDPPRSLFRAIAKRNWAGPMDRGEIHSTALDVNREFFLQDNEILQVRSTNADLDNAESGIIPSHYTTRKLGRIALSAHKFSSRIQRNTKNFSISELTSHQTAVTKLGAPILITSRKYNVTDLPAVVTGFEVGGNGFGKIDFMEMKQFRLKPDAIISESGFSGVTVSEIIADPLAANTATFAASTSTGTISLSAGYTDPGDIDTTRQALARVRFEAITSSVEIDMIEIEESASTALTDDTPIVLAGDFTQNKDLALLAGETAAVGTLFDPTIITDFDDFEIKCTFVLGGGTCRVYGIDFIYWIL